MEFSAVLRSRRSIRAFSDRPVQQDTINDILLDAIESPSSSNTQPYKVAVADGDTMTLSSGASGTDNIYNGSALYIASGLGSGQVREITDYVGATKVVQLKTTCFLNSFYQVYFLP